MTIEQIRAAIEWIAAVIRGLSYEADGESLRSQTDEEAAQCKAGFDELERLKGMLAQHERLAELADQNPAASVRGDNPRAPSHNRGDDPFDLRSLSFTADREELRGRAVTAIESMRNVPDAHRANAVALLERIDTPSGALARHILATGSEAYRSGWQKMVSGNGHLMTNHERTAIDKARALSLTDANGGFAVPFVLDPTIISTKDTSTNPFRRISTVKTTVSESWNGVTSGGMTVSWDGEAVEVSDDSPTLAQPSIRVHKAQGFAVGSIEISQDWAGIEADLREMIAESKDDAEAIVFTTGLGDGSNQPFGIITALDGTSSEVAPATPETFAAADIYAVENALPAKYRLAMMNGDTQASRASWIGGRPTYNDARQFDSQGGSDLWVQLGGGLPPTLLGHRAYEASAMRSTDDINAAATADNHILALGDFRYYHIVDRIGLSVEFVPHVFGANGRPTGQRGWYCYWRVGADSVNDDAFRVLNVATTA